MYKDYELKKVTEKLENELKEAEAQLAAWEKVTFPTKKDGMPFKNMKKNISGAAYFQPGYNWQGENVLRVLGRHGYDEIDCYDRVEDLQKKGDKKAEKTKNFMPKEMYLKQLYVYDVEDIKEAVNDRIDYLRIRIERLKDELANLESTFNKFFEAVCAASRDLADAVGKNSSAYYAMMETLKDNTYNLIEFKN